MHSFKTSKKLLVSLICFCIVFTTQAFAEPTITLNDTPVPLFNIAGNLNHGCITPSGYKHISEVGGVCIGENRPYGAWIDGPLNPYKYGSNTYFQIPHSENFRIKVPNHSWGDRNAWSMEGNFATGAPITPSQRDTLESHYNNRNWIFSVYSENNTLYGLTHHEWYRSNVSIGGISGFLNGNTWIASIGWTNSTNGGASWTMRPISDGSSRLVVVPEPSSVSPQIGKTFGFMHPSNIVKEGLYYYVFTSTANFNQSTLNRQGVALFRTTNITTPINWQFWNGSGWTTINHNTYQGNSGQMPYIFFEKTNHCSQLYAMNVRKHKYSGKWITLGSEYCLASETSPRQAVFSWTNSLANPIDINANLRQVQQNGKSLLSNNYYSFFDVDGSADDNYQSIGNNPLIVVTGGDFSTYYHHFLTLSGF